MIHRKDYLSDLIGTVTLASEDGFLVGCWFEKGRYFGYGVKEEMVPVEGDETLELACCWLERYFAGEHPDPHELSLRPHGTPFQRSVWQALLKIPYGSTATYGDVAKMVGETSGKRASARAVGGAVGHNPISIIVPCHRVVGASGSLTGFGGGIATKVKLLELEQVDMGRFFIPKKGTAL